MGKHPSGGVYAATIGAALAIIATIAGCTTGSPAPDLDSSTPPVTSSSAPTPPSSPPFAARPFAPPGAPDHEQVLRVIDGDTFVLTDQRHVRVLGIDSCEKNTAGGVRAQQFAQSLLSGHFVDLRTQPGHETDRYGRDLRYVTLDDGRDYAAVMVARDDTYVYPKQNDASPDYVAKLRTLDSNGRTC